MSGSDNTNIRELITMLRIDIAVLTEKVDAFNRVESKVDHMSLSLNSVTQDLESEKKRLDKVIKDHQTYANELKAGRKWAISTFLVFAGLMISFAGFVWSIIS